VLRVYHTSDLHDHRGIAAPLRALRANEPGLLFDCGDSLRGSQTIYHRREPIVAEIDAAGYDAQGIGNREFHYLYGCLRARAAQMQHPLVCTNLIDTKGRRLPFERSLTMDVPSTDSGETVRVHLLGLLIMQYPQGSAWERLFGWRFLDPVRALEGFAADIPQEDVLIVLSHVGLSLDKKVAAQVPRIDLLLGGHSHDTLDEPLYVGEVPIVHAGPYGKRVSRTVLSPSMSLRAGCSRWRVADFNLVPLLQ
jgi:2',3'-cyclic-nucleotide 2'-phosphodiesterase (5'-nucleotidase family)